MKFITIFILTAVLISCTKEVPEFEKKVAKNKSENEVRKIINDFQINFNDGKAEEAVLFFDENFSAYLPEVDTPINLLNYKNEILNFRLQRPGGKIAIEIEDVFADQELAAAQILTSYMDWDPVENKQSPVYSERSVILLKRNKLESWKIFRQLSTTAFTFD